MALTCVFNKLLISNILKKINTFLKCSLLSIYNRSDIVTVVDYIIFDYIVSSTLCLFFVDVFFSLFWLNIDLSYFLEKYRNMSGKKIKHVISSDVDE